MSIKEAGPRQQAVDWLFARLANRGGGASLPPPVDPAAETVDDLQGETSPPEVRSAEDLRIATEWLRRERQRLEGYTRSQLGRIQEEQQAMIKQKRLNEQALILRAQEISRQEQLLVQRAQEIERGSESGQAKALAEALEQAREARQREEAALQARRAELEDRFAAADHVVLAAEQRIAEVDDLEDRLMREIQQREQAVRTRERELQEWQEQLVKLHLEVEEMAQEFFRSYDERGEQASRRPAWRQ